MRSMKTLLAVVVAGMMSISPAFAQKAVILFIDEAKLVATSKAGQSINEQLKAIADESKKELETVGKQLEKKGQDLQKAQDSLSKDDFAKRYQALLVEAQEVGRLEQIKQAELQQSRAKAMIELNKELQPVVKSILDKKKATVLLERRAVVFANDDMDITDEIVKALDKKLKSVKVERVDLLAQAQAQQAAQKKKKK